MGELKQKVSGIPYVNAEHATFLRKCGVQHAIISVGGATSQRFPCDMSTVENVFPQLLLIPDFVGFPSGAVEAQEVCRLLVMKVRNSLIMRGPRMIKAAMDLFLTLLVITVAGPLTAILAALVKLDSPGPAFYGDERIGKDDARFTAWKLRTMHSNSDEILSSAFRRNPALREEWLRNQKLRKDPRLTRIGMMLRRSSLDELPQLWNILRGEMSLVGPRPIVADEISRYGDRFKFYRQVVPGLTGLWQVSGRSSLTYSERVDLDSYYVHNWSPWLDIYVLLSTVKVVVSGRGAY